jgi:hypothetical protein
LGSKSKIISFFFKSLVNPLLPKKSRRPGIAPILAFFQPLGHVP